MSKESRTLRAVMSKPIHPIVVRVAAAIVLGVATTVGIVWFLAYTVDGSSTGWRGRYQYATQVIPTPSWSQQRTAVHFAHVLRRQRRGTDIVEVREIWADDGRPPLGSPHALVEGTSFATEMREQFKDGKAPSAWWRADGWPLQALCAEARRGGDRGTISRVIGGMLIGSDKVSISDGVRILPLQPIWRGLVINTLLYAFLWFILFSLGDIRSRFRRRPEQCARCGYTLRPEQTRCSECGEVSGLSNSPSKRPSAAA